MLQKISRPKVLKVTGSKSLPLYDTNKASSIYILEAGEGATVNGKQTECGVIIELTPEYTYFGPTQVFLQGYKSVE
jgi:hypothetical protein